MQAQLLAAVVLLAAGSTFAAATDDPFVVHEWGTFTTVHTANGEQIWWKPPASVDVPDFVYRSETSRTSKPLLHPKDRSALARMETPVIYFYSQRERVVDVRVLFRGGVLTEWYPQATTVETPVNLNAMTNADGWRFLIEWNGVKVLPRGTREITLEKLIRSKTGEGDHYYIARDTDANFLRTSSPLARKGPEHERDLFYRGIGYFRSPLGVGIDADEQQLSLNALEGEQIAGAFLISIRRGLMRYQKIDGAITNAASVVDPNTHPFGALDDVRKLAMHDMARALVARGLYEKEALAMVNTWQDQWYAEEGTRVLYLLPGAWTDRTLPLHITPQPDRVVRVMVGRSELITPSVEGELKRQILTYSTGDAQAKSRAIANVRALGLGRFLAAATTRLAGDGTNEPFARSAWELVQAASAREDGRSARN
jgi:hypothetical protein